MGSAIGGDSELRRRPVTARLALSLALAAIAIAMVARFAMWFPPSQATYWDGMDLIHAIGSSAEDYLLILILIAAHGALRSRWARPRPAIDLLFVLLYLVVGVFAAFNVVSIYAVGSPFDMSWLAKLNVRDSTTVVSLLAVILTPSMIVFLIGCLAVIPVASYLLIARVRLDIGTLVRLSAALLFGSMVIAALVPPAADRFSQVFRTRNPILSVARDMIMPSNTARRLLGEANLDPAFDALVTPDEWTQSRARPPQPCCAGMNVVLVTLDSVPWRRASRDHVLANAASHPNLARLYRSGIGYENFYSNYPASTEALGVMAGSIYASNWLLTNSVSEWADRDLPTLPAVLAANGYTSAHFMSGELAYDGVDRFLLGRGFSTTVDSSMVRCGPDDAALMARYTHKGDQCIADAAGRWIAAQRKLPFFLWVWFSNPHAPYYTRSDSLRDAPRSVERHAQSIRDTDAALGRLIGALERRGLLERTIIVLTADHGEAFGEHGLFYHGTSLHDEQIRIPLIISAPGLRRDGVSRTLGSHVDLAPTITSLVGVPAPAAWQGGSLFASNRTGRVYFTSLSGGRMAGYREGGRKYILSSLDAEPYYYDLSADPNERRPLALPPLTRRLVAARLGGFIRNRNQMIWPRRVLAE